MLSKSRCEEEASKKEKLETRICYSNEHIQRRNVLAFLRKRNELFFISEQYDPGGNAVPAISLKRNG